MDMGACFMLVWWSSNLQPKIVASILPYQMTIALVFFSAELSVIDHERHAECEFLVLLASTATLTKYHRLAYTSGSIRLVILCDYVFGKAVAIPYSSLCLGDRQCWSCSKQSYNCIPGPRTPMRK